MVWVLCVLAIGSGEETPKDTVEPVEDARSGFDVALSPSIAVTPQTSLLLGLGTIAYGEDPDLGGAGLRIALGDEEDERGANLRLDYAVDSDNDQTFYVALGEAF
ncbi:MAG: hypothetical protein AAFZ38_03185 [Myxococcota bacterium]